MRHRLGIVLGAVLAGTALLVGVASTPGAANTATWSDVEAYAVADAQEYGISADWLLGVLWCEARGNPYAVGALGEIGPGQFHPRGVWSQIPIFRSWVDVFDVRLNVRAVAWAFSRGLSFHWSCAR